MHYLVKLLTCRVKAFGDGKCDTTCLQSASMCLRSGTCLQLARHPQSARKWL